MKQYTSLLSVILLIQLVITGLLFSADSNMDDVSARVLLNVNESDLDKIQIIEDNDELTLIKREGSWRLEKYPELPIVDEKIAALTNDLANMHVTWPITSTKSSHERFKVTQENFNKHIVFTNTYGNSQALLLGASPGFKQLYARNIQEDDVFTIEYSAYQLSTEENNWLDKSLLSVHGINKISHPVINLAKKEKKWQLTKPAVLKEQQALDTENITDLANQLTRLSVSGIANESYEATNQLVIYDEKNKEYIYSFASQDDGYFVKRNDIDQWFTLSKFNFEQFTNLSLDKFITENHEQTEGEKQAISE